MSPDSKKPLNVSHAIDLYNLDKEKKWDRVYTFTIQTQVCNSMIFIGPVKGGKGYQINPNSCTADVIRTLIIQNKVQVEKLNS